MDNERRFQLAMSWGKHAPVAIARLVPVWNLPRFVLHINCLWQKRVYSVVVEIPTVGIFLSRIWKPRIQEIRMSFDFFPVSGFQICLSRQLIRRPASTKFDRRPDN